MVLKPWYKVVTPREDLRVQACLRATHRQEGGYPL